jgi:hypothetical protein
MRPPRGWRKWSRNFRNAEAGAADRKPLKGPQTSAMRKRGGLDCRSRRGLVAGRASKACGPKQPLWRRVSRWRRLARNALLSGPLPLSERYYGVEEIPRRHVEIPPCRIGLSDQRLKLDPVVARLAAVQRLGLLALSCMAVETAVSGLLRASGVRLLANARQGRAVPARTPETDRPPSRIAATRNRRSAGLQASSMASMDSPELRQEAPRSS